MCAGARSANPDMRTGQAHGDDEDPRVARIVELLAASFSSAQQRRTPRQTGGAGTAGGTPPARRAARDCPICILQGRGVFPSRVASLESTVTCEYGSRVRMGQVYVWVLCTYGSRE